MTKQFNLSEIRHDIADLLGQYEWNTYFHIPQTWRFPAVIVDVETIEYMQDYSAGALIHLRLSIYASLAEHENAQQIVDAFVSTGDTPGAAVALMDADNLTEIESFKTLQVMSAENFRVVNLNDSQMAYAADLLIDVRT